MAIYIPNKNTETTKTTTSNNEYENMTTRELMTLADTLIENIKNNKMDDTLCQSYTVQRNAVMRVLATRNDCWS